MVVIGILFQSGGLAISYLNKSKIVLPLFAISIFLMTSSIFILSDDEKKREKLEINDERNSFIRPRAHYKTNMAMVFIELLISVICMLLNYYNLAMLFAILIVLNGFIVCIYGANLEKKL